MQFQFRFHNDFIYTGFTAGYKLLKPRNETVLGEKTEKMIGSYNLQAFAAFKTKPVTVKLEGVYGQNLSNYVMLGGYGADVDPYMVGNEDYSYVNLNTLSIWSEVSTNFKKLNGGIFFGYSQNLGASEDYFSLTTPTLAYARGENIDHILRISPRVEYTSGKITLTLEHMFSSAVYGTTFDSKQKATDKADPTSNHRIIFGAKYFF